MGISNLAETPRCYRIERFGMWGRTRQTFPTKVSPEFSDARSDVFQNGRFGFRDRGVVTSQRHHMNQITSPVISSRQKVAGSDHHLWSNHGTWWFHCTEHRLDGTARRIRLSLRTRDLARARLLRDAIISKYAPCS